MTSLHGELTPAELAVVVLPLGPRRRICLADEDGTPEALLLARPPVVQRFLGMVTRRQCSVRRAGTRPRVREVER